MAFDVFGVDELKVSNLTLDEDYVRMLERGIRNGSINPEDFCLFVGIRNRERVVNDGNHRLEALKRCGIKTVKVETYLIEE